MRLLSDCRTFDRLNELKDHPNDLLADLLLPKPSCWKLAQAKDVAMFLRLYWHLVMKTTLLRDVALLTFCFRTSKLITTMQTHSCCLMGLSAKLFVMLLTLRYFSSSEIFQFLRNVIHSVNEPLKDGN
jgi:hypothetical protein